MTRLLVVSAASVGLILLMTFVVVRLIRSRVRGLSVRMQVFLALAFIVGAFAFGLGLLVIDRVEARAERLARASATSESRAIAAIVQSEIQRTGASFETVATQLETYDLKAAQSSIDEVGLELVGPGGELLFPKTSRMKPNEPGAVFVEAAVTSGGRHVGTVRVVKPTIVVQAMLADFAPTVLAISLLLGAVAALAAAWIGRTIAAPIEALSEYSQKVAGGQHTLLPSRVAGRELAHLVDSIDVMRRQLEGRPFVETFAADLSHELKNPVAAIRASAEVLQDGALDEPEQAARFVARIAEAAGRIERLLEELLSLAQVETHGAESLERVGIAGLLDEILSDLPSGKERITSTTPSTSYVRGDARWLRRALRNLIDNALLHSPPGTPIQVAITSEADTVSFQVQSQGEVSPHVKARLFRRFVTTRGDKGGTGLGLSIVRAVAEAHGGQVELTTSGPPEVRFSLGLPRAN